MRLDGSLEFLSTPHGMISLLYSPGRKDLCAAYLPGIDVIRIGAQAAKELIRAPEAVARIFVHEACHQRFFRATPGEQRRLSDLLNRDSECTERLIELFYSSRFGLSYAGSHDKTFNLSELLVASSKSGLRDSRVYQRRNGNSIRIGNFATELYAYMSVLFLPEREIELAKEAKTQGETTEPGSFFGTLPGLLESLFKKASQSERDLLKRLYIDCDPKSIAKFKNVIRQAEARLIKK